MPSDHVPQCAPSRTIVVMRDASDLGASYHLVLCSSIMALQDMSRSHKGTKRDDLDTPYAWGTNFAAEGPLCASLASAASHESWRAADKYGSHESVRFLRWYVIVQMALFLSTVQSFVFLAAVQKSIPD